jgi:hypothetical protein
MNRSASWRLHAGASSLPLSVDFCGESTRNGSLAASMPIDRRPRRQDVRLTMVDEWFCVMIDAVVLSLRRMACIRMLTDNDYL